MKRLKKLLIMLTCSAMFGFAAAMATAMVLGVYDLGRGSPDRPRLAREWISIPEWQVFMSRADVAVLAVGVIVALLAAIAIGYLLRVRENNR